MSQNRITLPLEQILNTPAAFGREPRAHERPWIVGAITCQDGTTLSVQACHGHYCWPRDDDGPWHQVEVKLSADPGPGWAEHQDGKGSDIYAYVPVELVKEFIAAHGGEKLPTA